MKQLLGFHEVARRMRDASTCPTCGKSRMVFNTAGYRRTYSPEPVSSETHCACEGGPAALTRTTEETR